MSAAFPWLKVGKLYTTERHTLIAFTKKVDERGFGEEIMIRPGDKVLYLGELSQFHAGANRFNGYADDKAFLFGEKVVLLPNNTVGYLLSLAADAYQVT